MRGRGSGGGLEYSIYVLYFERSQEKVQRPPPAPPPPPPPSPTINDRSPNVVKRGTNIEGI